MTRGADAGEAGFTLVELIVALALFGLIAVAGLALVESVLRVQSRTDGRLDRIADVQRAMYVVTSDLQQLAAGPIAGTSTTLAFRRHAAALDGRGQEMRYLAGTGTLERAAGDAGPQVLLERVDAIRWRYYAAGEGWRDSWPISPQQAKLWPRAVSVEMVLRPLGSGPAGRLRRVVDLPVQP